MGISEVQRQFSAYGSGELPALELRNCIRNALSEDPQLSPAFVALAEAYRRANLIDANLQLVINADIAEVTGPRSELTMVRSVQPGAAKTAWLNDSRAANSTDVNVQPGSMAGAASMVARHRGPDPVHTDLPFIDDASQPRYTAATDSNWRTGPQSAERASHNTGNPLATTGSTNGSAWEIDERLAEVAAPLYPGSVIRDRFVLVEELGRGGMGVVYKAFDRSRGDARERYVAIKVLNEEFKRHPLAVRALQREARKAQKLAHPNVVTVYDFDRDAGNVYMVMEFLSGRSLEQVIRDDGRGGIPIVPAMEIVRSLGAALSYAHEQDIIHSDFKPSNAFLSREGKVKVLDFGIARAAPSLLEKGDRTVFDAGQLGAISPAYASLEMLRGEDPDVRDDVYAFACVTYELLTGCHPYQRIDALKAFQTGLQPRSIRKLSRSQWRALKQGLAFQRADRCPSVDSFVSQLATRRSSAKIWITAAAISLAAVALVGTVAWQWDAQRVATLQRGLASAAPVRFSTALAELRAAPGFVRSQVLEDSQSRAELTGYFQREIRQAAAPPSADYTRAHALLSEMQGLLPASEAALQLDRELEVASQAQAARQAPAVTTPIADESNVTATSTPPQVQPESSDDTRHETPAAPPSPEVVAESVALERDRAAKSDAVVGAAAGTAAGSPAGAAAGGPAGALAGEEKRAGYEMLKEKFETQAASGDLAGAGVTAATLGRTAGGSVYVTRDVPQILISSYLHLAKTQFAGGQVDPALQTLALGRKKFGRSPELKDLEVRYVAAGDVYDRLSGAVALNVADMRQSLEALRVSEGDEYETAVQMLVQTLADRIADQRAANRASVADKLLADGREIFPNYTGLLSRGTPGLLPDTTVSSSEK